MRPAAFSATASVSSIGWESLLSSAEHRFTHFKILLNRTWENHVLSSSTQVILLTLGSVPTRTRTGSGRSLVSHLFILSGAYAQVYHTHYFSLLVSPPPPIIFFVVLLLHSQLNGWENYSGHKIWWDVSTVSQNGHYPYVRLSPALENVWHSWPSELNNGSVPSHHHTNKNVLRGLESLNSFSKVRIFFFTVYDLLW